MAIEWWIGIGIGLFYTAGIAVTGAGLRQSVSDEGCLGAAWRVLGGGLLAGFVSFAVVRWLLPLIF